MPLAILPPIEPPEALRSYVDRLVAFNRIGFRDLGLFLFGRVSRPPEWRLPTGLNGVTEALGSSIGISTPQKMLAEHTLAPLYASTMTDERRRYFEGRLLEVSNGPRRAGTTTVLQEWLQPGPWLCRACDDEHRRSHGFSIVRREWIAPFNMLCPQHGESLTLHVDWKPSGRGPAAQRQATTATPFSMAWSKTVEQVLTGEASSLRHRLATLLVRKGFKAPKGSYRMAALSGLVLNHMQAPDAPLEVRQLASSKAGVARLLGALRGRGDLHPFIAWLLIRVLQTQPDVVPQDELWAGQEFDSASVSDVDIGVPHARARLPTSLSMDARESLAAMLSGGLPVKEAAASAGISLTLAYRFMASNGDVQALRAERRCDAAAREHEEVRGRWTDLLTANPEATTSELRKREPALYAWLYRNDREWLATSGRGARAERKDGATRERPRVPEAADEALAAAATEVSASNQQMGRQLHLATVLERAGRAHKRFRPLAMPLAAQATEGAVENTDQFVERRLRAALRAEGTLGYHARLWRVERSARIRPETIARSSTCAATELANARHEQINAGCEELED